MPQMPSSPEYSNTRRLIQEFLDFFSEQTVSAEYQMGAHVIDRYLDKFLQEQFLSLDNLPFVISYGPTEVFSEDSPGFVLSFTHKDDHNLITEARFTLDNSSQTYIYERP